MSELTFKTAVCRSCDHKWDLPRVYGETELNANLNSGERLALCPKCKHPGVSFPIYKGEPPKKAKISRAAESEPEDLNERTDVLLEPIQPEE